MKTFLKILGIGAVATICRLVFQLLIPDAAQTVLPPSSFMENGTLPLAFSIYAIFVYSVLAALFLLVRQGIAGTGVVQGLKYAFALCVLWAVYLFEPLPHATSIMKDSVAYVLADGIALLIMGLMAGWLLPGKDAMATKDRTPRVSALIGIVAPMIVFVAGRLLLYTVFDIYSSFDQRIPATISWCVAAGVVASGVTLWLADRASVLGKFCQPFVVGLMIYAVNLVLFNGFLLLVFDFSKLDLVLRTGIDIIALSLGLWLAAVYMRKR